MDKKRIKNSPQTMPTNKKYIANNKRKMLALRKRIGAGVLAAAIGVGAVVGIKSAMHNAYEDKHVTSMEEIEQYGLNARDLNISEESFQKLKDLQERMENIDLKDLSNSELADYFTETQNLQLNLLKDKIGNLIGKNNHEFTLVAPGTDARTGIRSGTRVMDNDMVICSNVIDSKEIDGFMEKILEGREFADSLRNGDVDRSRTEAYLKEMVDGLDEVASMQVMKKDLKGKEISSYWIEKSGLSPKTSDMQQDIEIEK